MAKAIANKTLEYGHARLLYAIERLRPLHDVRKDLACIILGPEHWACSRSTHAALSD